VSRSLQHPIPPLELKFVSKGGTLEIPPTGAICKVGKFCCLAKMCSSIILGRPFVGPTSNSAIAERPYDARVTSIRKIAKCNS